MNHKLRAGILGATGAVGQKFVSLLADHPWFSITALAASERSSGKKYGEATNWLNEDPIPTHIADMVVQSAEPELDCDFVFSGLDATVADRIEASFASAGYPVISNARNYRMHDNVPLLIPDVNPDHIQLIDHQKWSKTGFIVTNPNCSTVGLTVALYPLHTLFGIESVQVTTLQALSGAGYPGVPALDILGNAIPFISGEEQKMETEPLKILGQLDGAGIKQAEFRISAQCNRVPVINGHLETVSVKLSSVKSVQQVTDAFNNYASPIGGLGLPSEPDRVIEVYDDPRFPQPRLHANSGNGMTVSVGRIRACPVLDFKFVVLSHNTIRGAAGGAILNAEWLTHQGKLKARA